MYDIDAIVKAFTPKDIAAYNSIYEQTTCRGCTKPISIEEGYYSHPYLNVWSYENSYYFSICKECYTNIDAYLEKHHESLLEDEDDVFGVYCDICGNSYVYDSEAYGYFYQYKEKYYSDDDGLYKNTLDVCCNCAEKHGDVAELFQSCFAFIKDGIKCILFSDKINDVTFRCEKVPLYIPDELKETIEKYNSTEKIIELLGSKFNTDRSLINIYEWYFITNEYTSVLLPCDKISLMMRCNNELQQIAVVVKHGKCDTEQFFMKTYYNLDYEQYKQDLDEFNALTYTKEQVNEAHKQLTTLVSTEVVHFNTEVFHCNINNINLIEERLKKYKEKINYFKELLTCISSTNFPEFVYVKYREMNDILYSLRLEYT